MLSPGFHIYSISKRYYRVGVLLYGVDLYWNTCRDENTKQSEIRHKYDQTNLKLGRMQQQTKYIQSSIFDVPVVLDAPSAAATSGPLPAPTTVTISGFGPGSAEAFAAIARKAFSMAAS